MPRPLTEEQLKFLNNLYYDERFTFGRDKIFKLCQSKGLSISRRAIMEWLRKQETHQLFLKTTRNRVIKPTILKKPNSQIAIDLIDMSRTAYNGYNWILTCIDLFSKKAYAVALKTKKSKLVADAFDSLLKDIGEVSSIRSDRGSEFISKEFKSVLEKHDITQVLSQAHTPQSNGGVERFNQTLKGLIKRAKYISNDYDWVNGLQKLVDNYNSSSHRITKHTPDEVDEQNQNEIHDNIKKSVTPANIDDKNLSPLITRVRIKLKNPDEDKGTKWSDEVYVIDKVNKPRKSTTNISYKLKGLNGIYYRQDLQVVPNVENQIEKQETFTVGKIIEPMVLHKKQGYLIHWKGYSSSDDSFVERESLIEDIPKILLKYEEQHGVVWTKDKKQGWRWRFNL